MRPDRIDVYEDDAGEWRWRLIAPNGQILADSGEGYSRRSDAKRAATRAFIHEVRTRKGDPA